MRIASSARVAFISACFLALHVPTAQADTMVITDNGGMNVTGITGLEFGSMSYDIVFSASGLQYDEAYSVPPSFPTNEPDAGSFSAAIADVLNTWNPAPTSIVGLPFSSSPPSFILPYGYTPGDYEGGQAEYTGWTTPYMGTSWSTAGSTTSDFVGNAVDSYTTFAMVSPSVVVPEPASIIGLFGILAAGSLIGILQQQRRKAQLQ